MSCILSIIIPSYNCEPYLKNALASLQHQEVSNVEIIVVNDGSTDGTKAWLDTYATSIAGLKVIHQENKGAAAAKNTGLQHVRGTYFTILDADDALYDNCLAPIIAQLERSPVDVLYLPFDTYDEQGQLLEQIPNIGKSGTITKGILHPRRTLPPVIYKTILAQQHHIVYPRILIGEDSVFNFKLQFFAEKVSSLDIPYYKYTQRASSISKQGASEKALQGFLDGIQEVYNFEQTLSIDDADKQQYFVDMYHIFITRILELNILPTLNAVVYLQLQTLLKQIGKQSLMQRQDAKYPYFSKSFAAFKRHQQLLQLKSKAYRILFKK